MNKTSFKRAGAALATALLASCSGNSSPDSGQTASTPSGQTSSTPSVPASSCPETGPYACKSGASEPLYKFQWTLKQSQSIFATLINYVSGSTDNNGVSDGSTDLNVESVHTLGIKGAGVNVLVLDDGVEAAHEDLAVDTTMSYNFETQGNDPTPSAATGANDAHGTNVAGIIAALQNGKGIMGVAPKATLGGVRFIGYASTAADFALAYGGGTFSRQAHVINASYGANPTTPLSYEDATADPGSTAMSAFPALRSGKGLIYVKAAGNEYQSVDGGARTCPGVTDPAGNSLQIASCSNPGDDTESLSPLAINVAAASAKGLKASYSSAGAVNWITGLGGEASALGNFGEQGPFLDENGIPANGPQNFSTDLSGCARGFSRDGLLATDAPAFSIPGTQANATYNPDCRYSVMNGTSAATPTITGVVALMLSANPGLTWRDVRDILRMTARQIDANYGNSGSRNLQVNLQNAAGQPPVLTTGTASTLTDGSTVARLELGWQKNAAGNAYSNWYGFGLVDAEKAVAMARSYSTSRPATFNPGPFSTVASDIDVPYGRVSLVASIPVTAAGTTDEFQIRLNSSDNSLCIGSVGFYVQSPSGTLSALSLPYNVFYKKSNAQVDVKLDATSDYGQGSFAFYGETAAGTWRVYAVAGVPESSCTTASTGRVSIDYRLISAL